MTFMLMMRHNHVVLYIGTGTFGVFLSSVAPTAISLAELYIDVTCEYMFVELFDRTSVATFYQPYARCVAFYCLLTRFMACCHGDGSAHLPEIRTLCCGETLNKIVVERSTQRHSGWSCETQLGRWIKEDIRARIRSCLYWRPC